MTAKTTTPTEFRRIVSPGTGPYGRLYITIRYKNSRLSITGVEGPKSNGDAHGSCGQCIDALARLSALDWPASNVSKLRDIWDEWHLNDTRAGCKHQRARGWTCCPGHYGDPNDPNRETCANAEQRRAASAAVPPKLGHPFCVTQYHLAKSDSMYLDPSVAPCGICKRPYDEHRTDEQRAEHARPKTHYHCEADKLSQPCPECGYKYGTAWLSEPVPSDVLEWLSALPTRSDLPSRWA